MANIMRKLSRVLVTTAASLVVGASAALAADLPARQYAPAPVYNPAPLFTWSGFHAGVNGGYGWSNRNQTYLGSADTLSSKGSNGGFVGGGQIGYNYQLVPGTGLVVGLETDLQYADLGNKTTYVAGSPAALSGSSSGGNYFGTVRGRLGYAFDRFLVYGTGGFAYGDVGSRSWGPLAGNRGTEVGYTLGGGLEYALTNNWTAKVEALYVSLGNGSRNTSALGTPAISSTSSGRDDFGVVRAGLNYKF
ncbi:outer membrane protein [Microvirga sp. TS319]|uniref:outer membrane protein n=1 Tax=Microvirga sp. TS319 TaxID=3241165 RepID=UPI00351A0E0B